MSIAQIESGTRRDWNTVELEAVYHDAAELYEPLTKEKSIAFSTDIHETATVMGNCQLLAQVVRNLRDNAIKYTPTGGRVTLNLAANGPHTVITVTENGPGILPELCDKTLQRFARLDASRSTPGNGPGLSLVKAVAEHHGASLMLADNHPGLRIRLDFTPEGR